MILVQWNDDGGFEFLEIQQPCHPTTTPSPIVFCCSSSSHFVEKAEHFPIFSVLRSYQQQRKERERGRTTTLTKSERY
jgi:hypothetical protein